MKRTFFSIVLLLSSNYSLQANVLDDFKDSVQEAWNDTIEGIKECWTDAKADFIKAAQKAQAKVYEIKDEAIESWQELVKKDYDAIIVHDKAIADKAYKKGYAIAKLTTQDGQEQYVILCPTAKKEALTKIFE